MCDWRLGLVGLAERLIASRPKVRTAPCRHGLMLGSGSRCSSRISPVIPGRPFAARGAY